MRELSVMYKYFFSFQRERISFVCRETRNRGCVKAKHSFFEFQNNKTCEKGLRKHSRLKAYLLTCFFSKRKLCSVCSMLGYLAWPFTILQNDNITISWDFSQADSTSSHAGTPWCWQSEKNLMIIVILSFCDIVNGQAKYSPHHVRAATDNF